MLDGEYLEIQGNLAQIVERRVTRQVPLEEALRNLQTAIPVTFPTIGRTQVFGHYDASQRGLKRTYILSEIPAGIKNISKNIAGGRARRYRLAMPWTYLWFGAETGNADSNAAWSINDYKIFQSRTRYSGIDQEMIVARLPNVYGDGRICWGTTGASPNATLADRIDQLTNEWFLSRFNTDLDGGVPLPYGEPNYRRWVAETRENPSCWQNWPEWASRNVIKYTVRSLLANAGETIRTEEIVLPNSIPEVPVRLTFGSWEQWWSRIPEEERVRARISMENYFADNPTTAFVDDVEEIETDDGGTDIPFAR